MQKQGMNVIPNRLTTLRLRMFIQAEERRY
jgi:hypothetical protein